MNIRYHLINPNNGHKTFEIYSLEEVETGYIYDEGWRILSRDLGTGKLDIARIEIFENDCIEGDLFDNRLPIAGMVAYDAGHSFFVLINEAGETPLFKVDHIEVIGREE